MTGLAVLLCAALAVPPEGPAPPPAVTVPAALHRSRARTQLAGMGALTGWAALNIVGGVAGNFASTGEVRYFHQMNALWNTVNLVIGAVGLASARRERARGPRGGPDEARRASLRAMATYSINAGLDVLYIMAGVTTLELGRVHERPRLVGYGESVVLQGAFLLAFDAALLAAHGAGLRRVRPRAALAPGGALLGLQGRF